MVHGNFKLKNQGGKHRTAHKKETSTDLSRVFYVGCPTFASIFNLKSPGASSAELNACAYAVQFLPCRMIEGEEPPRLLVGSCAGKSRGEDDTKTKNTTNNNLAFGTARKGNQALGCQHSLGCFTCCDSRGRASRPATAVCLCARLCGDVRAAAAAGATL